MGMFALFITICAAIVVFSGADPEKLKHFEDNSAKFEE